MRRVRPNCNECPVLKKGLCGALSSEEKARLSSAAWCRRYYPGQVIHAEGEKPACFCAIISGVVKLLKSLPNGTQQIVRLLLPGDFLGRPFGDEPRATAVAATEVSLCWFPRAVVESHAGESRSVERWLFEHVSDELEKAQDRITLLGRMTAEQRIATFILWVARRARLEGAGAADASGGNLIELPLSRTEMADYLGLTIETVSRQLGRLRERGIITVGAFRTIIIHRPEVLEAALAARLPGERPKDAVQL
jgi:CRP/FNR family transcriptional regulator